MQAALTSPSFIRMWSKFVSNLKRHAFINFLNIQSHTSEVCRTLAHTETPTCNYTNNEQASMDKQCTKFVINSRSPTTVCLWIHSHTCTCWPVCLQHLMCNTVGTEKWNKANKPRLSVIGSWGVAEIELVRDMSVLKWLIKNWQVNGPKISNTQTNVLPKKYQEMQAAGKRKFQ